MTYPQQVKVVEVGPRDGLQNEARTLSVDIKLTWIEQLAQTGLQHIEVGSFVSPKWVPQMADTSALVPRLRPHPNIHYSVLIPNQHGLAQAIQSGAQQFALFTASSETFTQKNINCSIAESFKRFGPIAAYAKMHSIPLRGYLSCAFACPYEGAIDPAMSARLSRALLDLGCEEISLGDTLGVATPKTIQALLNACRNEQIDFSQLALHCHDTYGQALTNIYAGLCEGITVFDAANAGLGGCPYALGATGNVATEDVLYLLNGLGIETGIDLKALIQAGHYICQHLHASNRSKVALASP